MSECKWLCNPCGPDHTLRVCVFVWQWVFYSIVVMLYSRHSQSIWRRLPKCPFEIMRHSINTNAYTDLQIHKHTQTHNQNRTAHSEIKFRNFRSSGWSHCIAHTTAHNAVPHLIVCVCVPNEHQFVIFPSHSHSFRLELSKATTSKLQTHFWFGQNFARNTLAYKHKHKSVDINKTKQTAIRGDFCVGVLGERERHFVDTHTAVVGQLFFLKAKKWNLDRC